MFEFRCVLEFLDLGMKKVYTFPNKADARRYAAMCNARILSIECVEKPLSIENEPIII